MIKADKNLDKGFPELDELLDCEECRGYFFEINTKDSIVRTDDVELANMIIGYLGMKKIEEEDKKVAKKSKKKSK